jgi:hypothetical protein
VKSKTDTHTHTHVHTHIWVLIAVVSEDKNARAEKTRAKTTENGEVGEKPVAAKGRSRLQQILEWCGPDFQGMVAFDEVRALVYMLRVRVDIHIFWSGASLTFRTLSCVCTYMYTYTIHTNIHLHTRMGRHIKPRIGDQ